MNVLVVGVSGFIGRRMVDSLRGGGHVAYGLSRRACDIPGCDTRLLTGTDVESISAAIGAWAPDAVVNLAAAGVDPSDRDISSLAEINALLPGRLAEAAKTTGARAFIQIGSSAEYAAGMTGPIAESAPLERERLYGASKAAGALLVQATGEALGLPVAVLRLFNVFGPGEKPHRLLPSLFSRLGRAEQVPLSDGQQIRDFLFVDDACRTIVSFLEALVSNASLFGEYNLASGQPRTVAEFARAAAHAVGADPRLLQFGALERRKDDFQSVVADIGKLDRVLGSSDRLPFDEALRRSAIEWGLGK